MKPFHGTILDFVRNFMLIAQAAFVTSFRYFQLKQKSESFRLISNLFITRSCVYFLLLRHDSRTQGGLLSTSFPTSCQDPTSYPICRTTPLNSSVHRLIYSIINNNLTKDKDTGKNDRFNDMSYWMWFTRIKFHFLARNLCDARLVTLYLVRSLLEFSRKI